MGKAIGCSVLAVVVAVILAVVGVFLIKQGGESAQDAAIVAGLSPALAADVERASPGERVLVLGQIDPDTPLAEPSKGLAMYVRERYVVSTRRKSGGGTTTERSWERDGSAMPRFRLLADDGPVQIVNSGYELEQPRYDEPRETTNGALHYSGFSPGDSVLVDGVVQGDGIAARAVFGGDQGQYVAMLKSRASTSKMIGSILLGVVALPIVGVLIFVFVILRRRSNQTVAVGADYRNLAGPGGYGPPPPPGGYGGVVPPPPPGGYGGAVPPPPANPYGAPAPQCHNCHNPLRPGEAFCGRCGARIG